MADQNRWGEGRYEDRYRARDPRDEFRGDDFGRHHDEDPYRGDPRVGARYREDRSFDRERSTGGGDYSTGGYPSRGGYGEEAYRDRRYGTGWPPEDSYRPPSDRAAADNMLHRPPYDRGGERANDWYRGDYERGRGDYHPHPERSERNEHERAHKAERTPWDRARDEVSSWFGGGHDAQRRDHHVGKGPKGYVRSDERIREDVSDHLTQDWLIDASEIEVQVTGGEVTLTGLVADRSDKRRAEDIADHITGVNHVQNNLRIRQSGQAEAFGHRAPDEDKPPS